MESKRKVREWEIQVEEDDAKRITRYSEALLIDPENLEKQKEKLEILVHVYSPALEHLIFPIPESDNEDGIIIKFFASSMEISGQLLFGPSTNWHKVFCDRLKAQIFSTCVQMSKHESGITILSYREIDLKDLWPEEFLRLQQSTHAATSAITNKSDTPTFLRILKDLSAALSKAKPLILDDLPTKYDHFFYFAVGVYDEGVDMIMKRRDIPNSPAVRALYTAQLSFTDFYH